MRLTWKDAVATVLVAAIVVPFVGYMATGSMPFIQDPTGMAALALALGVLAAVVGGWWEPVSQAVVRYATAAVGIAAFAVTILALVSENFLDVAVREGLLIAVLGCIVVLWAATLLRHSGVTLTGHAGSGVAHA